MSISLPISPLVFIPNHPGNQQGISLFIKRDELLHPEIQGSKARKLAVLLPQIKESYPGGLVTFGGAFSNHLHAVAVAGRIFGIPTVGILRGEQADLQNPTLQFCQENGMSLHRIPKAEYDARKLSSDPLLGSLFSNCYFLPEGGNTPEALRACAAIPNEIIAQLAAEFPGHSDRPIYFCTPAGTGCTAAGIVAGLEVPNAQTLVFPVSDHGLDKEIVLQLLSKAGFKAPDLEKCFHLIHDYTFGGFAKFYPPVMAFVCSFFTANNILLDPIYTAKMLFGVFDMLAKGQFDAYSSVVVLHTGGLQGWQGFRARYGARADL
ncbi:MAG: 1-aminocyclopropane-1-carboxylate deaminase/D-cysteine desulfhydrase [Saprospiraceae bacterium]